MSVALLAVFLRVDTYNVLRSGWIKPSRRSGWLCCAALNAFVVEAQQVNGSTTKLAATQHARSVTCSDEMGLFLLGDHREGSP